MVSPELLRRYPFFGGLSDAQLREISMISEEEIIGNGETLVEECAPANKLYLVLDGSLDLSFRSADELNINPATPPKELPAGEVNSGDIFGVCSLIAPYVQNTTARTSVTSRVIVLDALQFRKLLNEDADLSNKMLKNIVNALMEQLAATRVQLAAAQS